MMDIAKHIDHSLLKPDATTSDILRLCGEAGEYGFHSVCIQPTFLNIASKALFKTHVKLASVIGFPLGMTLPKVKIYEAMESVHNGANELDIVMNIGLAKSGNWYAVEKEIADIVTATKGVTHKIIIETCYLTEDEKTKACTAVVNSGAEFIKTSTGFGAPGATIEDVKFIKALTGNAIAIKAAGGITTLKEVRAFLDAGAARIGTSSGVAIIKEMNAEEI